MGISTSCLFRQYIKIGRVHRELNYFLQLFVTFSNFGHFYKFLGDFLILGSVKVLLLRHLDCHRLEPGHQGGVVDGARVRFQELRGSDSTDLRKII